MDLYERHIFDKKNPYFKSRAFLKEIKVFYTELINENVKDPEKKLKVFDRNDVYVAQKKIGKGNPKEELIKANNEYAKEWNRLADYAMKLGVKKEKVMAVKEIEIKEAAKKSIKESGWKPGVFKRILSKAKDVLKVLINKKLRAIEALKAKSKTEKGGRTGPEL